MVFDAKDKTIKELFADHIFIIPINQRNYVWDERNWKDLITDVFLVCDENSSGHFIGSIVLEENENINAITYYKVIDGQQRIITLTILLSALYNIYLNNGLTKESEAIRKYCFAFNSNNEKFFIVENATIGLKNMVEDVFEKNEPFDFLWIESSLKNKSNENIFKAYIYFFDIIQCKIRNLGKERKKYLTKFFNTIIELSYINIISFEPDVSFTVFEILNARGQKLEDYELLKNILLKYSINKEQTKKCWNAILQNVTVNGNCYIKNFIKHYSMHKYKSSNYKSPYLVIRDNVDKSHMNLLEKDLFAKSIIYREFIFPQELDDNKKQKAIYIFFNYNKQTQYRPLLMSLTHQHNNGNINTEVFYNTLFFLKKFFVCFTLISTEKSNKIENVIYKYSNMLENEYSSHKLTEMIESLKNKFPTRYLFAKKLETLAWSKKNDSPYHEEKYKEKIKIVFNMIEEYYTANSPIVDFTLEHIFLDDGGDENSKIGNLLSLEESLNSKCANKNLKEKMPIYNESVLNMTRRFFTRYSTQEFKINERHNSIVKLLYEKILKI